VPLFGRRDVGEPATVDAELDRLRAIRISAEEELGRLRKELTERVATVERKERELADALAKVTRGGMGPPPPGTDEALAHAQVGLAARSQELNRRERELTSRERAFVQMETEIAQRLVEAAQTPADTLRHIEARAAALQKMEDAFARTQAELAERSDDLARREAELLEHGRALSGVGAGRGAMTRAELDELDERIRRLEQQTREASADRGFGDGLRVLERRGLGGGPPS
jgi:DNA repair exonuclease SbcCD ATPase subunit